MCIVGHNALSDMLHYVLLLQGNFTVSAQMPVLYTVQEVPGILNLNNKVRTSQELCWVRQISCCIRVVM